jgi:hypothetical protein
MSLTVLCLSLIHLFTPTRSFSNQENRYLQKLPTLNIKDFLSGKYTQAFEKYTTDQFPFRDFWIKTKTTMDLSLLKKDNGRVYFGKNGFLFDITTDFDAVQFDKNMGYINHFVDAIGALSQDINMSVVLIPSKEAIYSHLLPLYAPTLDESTLAQNIFQSLPEDVSTLYLASALKEKAHEYLYYKTDHHWTTTGAYYGYLALSSILGFEPYSKDSFHIDEVSSTFLGTVYRKANLYTNSPDSIFKYTFLDDPSYQVVVNETIETNTLYDEAYLDKTDQYSYFLGGDYGIVGIQTSIKNGKSVAIIKDSYANSFVPFLALHYEKIVLIDTRYFGGSIPDYIKDLEIDDLLLFFNTYNFAQFKTFHVFSR